MTIHRWFYIDLSQSRIKVRKYRRCSGYSYLPHRIEIMRYTQMLHFSCVNTQALTITDVGHQTSNKMRSCFFEPFDKDTVHFPASAIITTPVSIRVKPLLIYASFKKLQFFTLKDLKLGQSKTQLQSGYMLEFCKCKIHGHWIGYPNESNDQGANDQRANDQQANDQRANDQRANDPFLLSGFL